MSTKTQPLIDALAKRQQDYRDAAYRMLEGRTPAEIHKAFGAPGDFGYDTPIGDALAKVYRG